MTYIKVVAGIVTQVGPKPREGFVVFKGLAVCGQIYDSVSGELKNPIEVKTFDQELDSLNSKYDSDFNNLVNEYNRAVARDGATESVKVDTVRSKMTTLDSEYDDAFMALLIKYS